MMQTYLKSTIHQPFDDPDMVASVNPASTGHAASEVRAPLKRGVRWRQTVGVILAAPFLVLIGPVLLVASLFVSDSD